MIRIKTTLAVFEYRGNIIIDSMNSLNLIVISSNDQSGDYSARYFDGFDPDDVISIEGIDELENEQPLCED